MEDVVTSKSDMNIQWKGIFPNNIKMSDIEICILFSNLLKNAVTANNNISEKQRIINVSVKSWDSNVWVKINNPVDKDVNIVNNKLITTNHDKKNHGFGSQNIEDIVNKYNGSINYSCIDKDFSAEIILEDVICRD